MSDPKVFYKPFGPVTKIQFGNGVTQDWLYDDAYRIDRVTVKNSSNTNLLDWDYTLDATGNVDAINRSGSTTNYTQDAMDRLTGDGATVYGYDGNGNVTQAGYVNLTTVSQSNRLATRGGAAVYHDSMGNVTGDSGIVSFGYDNAGRLETLTRSPVGGPVQTFTNRYNGKGERSYTHRVLSPTDRYVEYYTYAEDGRLMTFVQSAQNPDNSLGVRTVYNYIWLDQIPVAQFRVRYPAICVAPTCTPIDTQLTYIHADHLYTPRLGTGYSASTQSSQAVVWSIWSSAYGFAGESYDPDGDGNQVSIVLRFPGQVYYGVSTFNYNYYRHYDTMIGRYLESDPIGLMGGRNTYGYANGNPLSYYDPLGLYCYSPELINAIAGGVGGAFAGGMAGRAAGSGGIIAGIALGGAIGASTGYFGTSASLGYAAAFGAGSGAATGFNSPRSAAFGGLFGHVLAYDMQNRGFSPETSSLAGGAAGGLVSGFASGFLKGQALRMASANSIEGLSGAAIALAVQKGLEAGNDCPCGDE